MSIVGKILQLPGTAFLQNLIQTLKGRLAVGAQLAAAKYTHSNSDGQHLRPSRCRLTHGTLTIAKAPDEIIPDLLRLPEPRLQGVPIGPQ